MFKHYFQEIQNVAVWPVISFIIFFGFFILLLWWLVKVDKNYLKKMKNLPLEKNSLKKMTVTGIIMGLPYLLSAQDQASSTPSDQDILLMWILITVLTIAVLVLLVAIYTMMVLRMVVNQSREPSATAKSRTSWLEWWDRFNNRVPPEKEDQVLLDHNYDGIRELDNHLPPWWTALFYFTIVFGVIYMLVYHVFEAAPLPDEVYRQEMAAAQTARDSRLVIEGEAEGSIDESTVTFVDDAPALQNGMQIFNMQCASCHREDGGGSIGPNLTDPYWLHGGSIQDIFRTIKYGVPQKGMISWEPLLTPQQMRDVSSYIITMQGSNPPNPKDAQGDLYEPEEDSESP